MVSRGLGVGGCDKVLDEYNTGPMELVAIPNMLHMLYYGQQGGWGWGLGGVIAFLNECNTGPAEKNDTNVHAAQEKATNRTKKILLGLQLDMASYCRLVWAFESVAAALPKALWHWWMLREVKKKDGWSGGCLHGKLEDHKFRMFFFSTRRSKLIHCADEMYFLTCVTHLPIEMNVHVACTSWQVPQIPACCLLASKISISNLSPLQGRRVNRLPSCCCCCWWWWWWCWCWRNKATTVDVVVFVWVLAVFVISSSSRLWLRWTGEHKQSHEVKKPKKLCNTKKKENMQNHQGQTSREKNNSNACLVFPIVSSATFGIWTTSCCKVFAACLNFNLPFCMVAFHFAYLKYCETVTC